MSLKGFYKENVITCTGNHLVTEAAEIMRDHHIGDLVVVRGENDKKPVGLITDRDIAIGGVASAADRIMDLSVEELMTKDPVCATDDMGVYEVAQKMRREGVSRMPVLDANGDVCGILSATNILALLNDELTEVISISDTHKEAGSGRRIMGSQPSGRMSAQTGPSMQ